MLVITLGAANLFGLMPPGYAGAAMLKEPPCGMACCVEGVCECQTIPAEAPTQPSSNFPVEAKQSVKFVPMLLVILPASDAGCTTVLVSQPAVMDNGKAAVTPMFRLHCAMLM